MHTYNYAGKKIRLVYTGLFRGELQARPGYLTPRDSSHGSSVVFLVIYLYCIYLNKAKIYRTSEDVSTEGNHIERYSKINIKYTSSQKVLPIIRILYRLSTSRSITAETTQYRKPDASSERGKHLRTI